MSKWMKGCSQLNIYCIGRNYEKHASELGNEVPDQPLLFSKPSHSLVEARGQEIVLPKGLGDIHYELEIVLKINKAVEKGSKVTEVVSEMALGLDLTLRDVQSELKKKGHPWLRAKGFKNSAIITEFWPFDEKECANTEFSFDLNGETRQKGHTRDMIFTFQDIIDECADCFGLGEGDLIYTGTPEGVGPIHVNDIGKLFWGVEEKGSFLIK
ncbi:fumarylacetoacetate hydrolase family protein [Alkalihalobacillus sp. MEB130]|uniref:fumarylacetoacetate hydrolase family protein n=1 Tax=Alkalihalobacillus sp. MEB130 TaxID=2976704 RepID=UPI0028DDF9A7|nr:fumarylacetoacetate hydrolase family protein [Alkalihalobacillus sp. MEB130]MDT8862326.1 fumarylacetoacetate hydrolase family protein [Alkalihalobacillus sp. MEB130]